MFFASQTEIILLHLCYQYYQVLHNQRLMIHVVLCLHTTQPYEQPYVLKCKVQEKTPPQYVIVCSGFICFQGKMTVMCGQQMPAHRIWSMEMQSQWIAHLTPF